VTLFLYLAADGAATAALVITFAALAVWALKRRDL
jgi:hypothetical protein